MISTETTRNYYTGNNTTADYDYDFKIFNREDIALTVNVAGAETTLVLNTDYEVYGAGDETGGNITLLNLEQVWLDVNGFLDLDVVLTITRDIPLTQEVDFRNQSEYYPEGHEDAFDQMTMLIQQQNEILARTLKQPITDSTSGLELPSATDRAGAYLGFDVDGNPVATTSVAGTASISPYMETVLDDANAAAARTTLGFTGAGGLVANADLVTVATQTFKGRTTAGTGAVEDLTVTQATAMLNAFTSALKGLVPASGGGTTTFLRADATFAALPVMTVQRFTSGTSQTYTTPAGCRWIRVRMVGGGGSGAGGGIPSPGGGSAGNPTSFGSLVAAGGQAGVVGGGLGSGTANTFSGTGFDITGTPGGSSCFYSGGGLNTGSAGGAGGSSYFGGGGAGGAFAGAGQTPAANSGSGGGGGGCSSSGASVMNAGSGGGSGGYIEAIITSPSATYTYTVGAVQSSVGAATTAGGAGGPGAAGQIIVEEYY